MPIQMAYHDLGSGASYPTAYWHADDVRIGLREQFTEITLGVYVDQTEFERGSAPIATVIERFTDAENTAARSLLTSTLYTILIARAEFVTGILV